MRIAHVYKDYYPPLRAGITRYIHDIALAASAAGHHVEVHVAGVRHSRREYVNNDLTIHRHKEFGRIWSMPFAPGLVTMGRSLDVDVVHVHTPNPLGEIGALLGSRPLVTSYHADLDRQKIILPVYQPIQQRVLDRSTAVLVASEPMVLTKALRTHRAKIRVLPYGLSPEIAHALSRVGDAPKAPNVGEPLRVLFVGRLVYYKGLDVLLRAAARSDDVHVSIIGSGPARPDLEALSLDLRVDDRVAFLGERSDTEVADAYGRHDVLVLPSVSAAEAFGLSMMEGMAAGLPVVSTSLGTGTDVLNKHHVSGLVVPPGDPVALAAALVELRDPALRAKLGRAARERVRKEYSFERHMERLLDVYRTAAEGRA